MKNLLLIIISTFSLVACNGGSEGGETPAKNKPVIDELPKWGELTCQKQARCEDPILNLDLDRINSFFENNYSYSEAPVTPDPIFSFSCGQNFLKTWINNFTEFENMNPENLKSLSQLGSLMINPEICLLNDNYIEQLNKYFVNTKEYKNETQ